MINSIFYAFHLKRMAAKDNILERFVMFGIVAIALNSCGQLKSKSIEKEIISCDSVIYSFRSDDSKSGYIDSVIRKESIVFCTFAFSSVGDTLWLRFNLGENLESYYRENYKSNRYLKLKNRLIPVLSDEDFFFSVYKPKIRLTNDGGYILFCFKYPDLSTISLTRYPPKE
jgi:hypothetical protein